MRTGVVPRGLRLLLATIAIGCSRAPDDSAAQPPAASATAGAQVSQSRRTAISEAVAKVAPAVVTVQTSTIDRSPVDPFEWFFGGRGPGTRVTPGLGSGFIVRASGVIVTNAHVVAGADSVSVMLRDGSVHPARVLGTDEVNDVAVLRIEGRDLPVVELGDSGDLLVGEWSIAIGNPYGFLLGNSEPSVTAGVISGVGRNLVGPGEGAAMYFDMIQTDASINPGNSGGPLVNAEGKVIGVNSSIYSTSGGSIGLGFAIPINRVVRVVDDLIEHGAVRRPWIGVTLQRTGTNPRDVIAAGATVAAVIPESPAARASLRPGDVITGVNGKRIRNAFDWQAAQLDLRVGETARLTVTRGGSDTELSVRVGDLPDVTAPKVEVLRELELVSVTPAIQAQRGLRSGSGALIYNVTPRVAAELGIQPGDVIVQINRQRIGSAEDAKQALDAFAARGVIQMWLERGGRLYSTEFLIR